ncbi:MAG: VCBS repeat-containing protein [Rhodothermales bacterium]|nr:VCBS repeat-containing protein [Rhodothermales bacterium]
MLRSLRPVLAAGLAALVLGPAPVAAQDFFEDLIVESLPPFRFGAAAWGDYDRDGDFDVLLAGNRGAFDAPAPLTQLYLNGGDFIVQVANPVDPVNLPPLRLPATRYVDALNPTLPTLTDVWQGDVAWGDYDGDGDLDAAVGGLNASGVARLALYRNVGGTERFVQGPLLGAFRTDALAWGDYDNDGDLDLAALGDENGRPATVLFENLGGENFARTAAGLPGLRHGDLAWGDADSDGDLDLAITGLAEPQAFVTRVYRNDGGLLTRAADLRGLLYASLDWGDYDADGDLDLLVSGAKLHPFVLRGELLVYENTNGFFFTDGVTLVGSFENDDTFGRYQGNAQWGDYDADGDLDFLITGIKDPLSSDTGQLYRNDGAARFTKTGPNERFRGGFFGGAFFGDYDGDHDLDVFVAGERPGEGLTLSVLRNPTPPRNTPPQAPGGLRATVQGTTVTLAWDAATDAQTPSGGLSYNLRVGTAPGAGDVVAPMALPSGRRLLTARGNADHNLGWSLRGLPSGTYFWSVQALDAAYAGSPFAPEGTFTIP